MRRADASPCVAPFRGALCTETRNARSSACLFRALAPRPRARVNLFARSLDRRTHFVQIVQIVRTNGSFGGHQFVQSVFLYPHIRAEWLERTVRLASSTWHDKYTHGPFGDKYRSMQVVRRRSLARATQVLCLCSCRCPELVIIVVRRRRGRGGRRRPGRGRAENTHNMRERERGLILCVCLLLVVGRASFASTTTTRGADGDALTRTTSPPPPPPTFSFHFKWARRTRAEQNRTSHRKQVQN